MQANTVTPALLVITVTWGCQVADARSAVATITLILEMVMHVMLWLASVCAAYTTQKGRDVRAAKLDTMEMLSLKTAKVQVLKCFKLKWQSSKINVTLSGFQINCQRVPQRVHSLKMLNVAQTKENQISHVSLSTSKTTTLQKGKTMWLNFLSH